MSQEDISSILLTKKVEARLLRTNGNRKVSLMNLVTNKELPKKIGYEVDEAIFELISYISDKSGETMVAGKSAKKESSSYPIRIISWPIIRSSNVHKFLVSLLIKKVISNLSLPIFVKKEGSSLEVIYDRYVFTEGFALEKALYSTDDFFEKIISFELINKSKFNKIKNELEIKKPGDRLLPDNNESDVDDSKEVVSLPAPLSLTLSFNDKTREIKINDILIAKPNFNSDNHSIFEHLFTNTDKTFEKGELRKLLGIEIKPFNDFLNDIKIKKTIRKYLVSVSKGKIKLTKHVEIDDRNDARKIEIELLVLEKRGN